MRWPVPGGTPAAAIRRITLRLNSGMFKNAFTCGIPGSSEVGNAHAAALGAVGADPDKGLECLDGITPEQARQAREMVTAGMVRVEMAGISSRIFIEATVTAKEQEASVTIRDTHTNIVRITENGRTVFEKPVPEDVPDGGGAVPLIHRYTLTQLRDYALTVPAGEIAFIRRAFEMNLALCKAGLDSPKTTYARYLLAENGGRLISRDEQATASLLCNGAIEARVLGLPQPAMSITGSGAHGIIATMPLYAACQVQGYPEEKLLRAAALSYLVCMYIKEYSGKLSAFCGCAIAAGTGMACGLVLLRDGDADAMARTICNMASSITGMICDGGNQGCTMKGVVAVDAAYRSVSMAMQGIAIDPIHGINGPTPEQTMRNMGLIASPRHDGHRKDHDRHSGAQTERKLNDGTEQQRLSGIYAHLAGRADPPPWAAPSPSPLPMPPPRRGRCWMPCPTGWRSGSAATSSKTSKAWWCPTPTA